VTTARSSQIEGGTVDANVGVGFAIPSDTVRSVAQQLIADGKVQHAYMGVQAETIPSGVSRLVRGIPGAGVTIASVRPGSPAAKAGLKAATSQVTADGQTALLGGDSITALDGKPIRSARASPARSPPTGRASASASRSCGGRRRGPSR